MSENIKLVRPGGSSPVKSEECQFAQMVLETFRSSGLSVKQFCKNEGILGWKFYQYKRILRQETIDHKNTAASDQNKSKPRYKCLKKHLS
ncbi:MAG: hypothetical protein ABIG61_15235 [Planctomycetota bacterium]